MKLLSFMKNKVLGSSIDYKILPRKVKFDWEKTPVDWIPNQPYASYFINEINNILPAGEFWFCRLYNKVLPQVTDEKLKHDVQAFIRQEAMHAIAHTSANKEYLSQRNIDIQRNLEIMDFLFTKALADKPFGKEVPKVLDHQWDLFRLGVIATVEHMTCVLGKYALYNERWEELGADPEMVDLVKWHGSEEIEHRTVAFDLYRHLGGGYIPRYYMSLAVITLVLGLAFCVTQFSAWSELVRQGIYFTGNPSGSFLYVLSAMHLLHLAGGILYLVIVTAKSYQGSYTAENHLPIDLCSIFWHFLDFLWVYLFIFLSMLR